jgi:hypothetical protein
MTEMTCQTSLQRMVRLLFATKHDCLTCLTVSAETQFTASEPFRKIVLSYGGK